MAQRIIVQPPSACDASLGLKLKKLLTKPTDLKAKLIENWDGYCKTRITETKEIPLEGDLLGFLEKFDFRIFKMIPVAQMIIDHAGTVFYVKRFGTASFPERPPILVPPTDVHATESCYVRQLFNV